MIQLDVRLEQRHDVFNVRQHDARRPEEPRPDTNRTDAAPELQHALAVDALVISRRAPDVRDERERRVPELAPNAEPRRRLGDDDADLP